METLEIFEKQEGFHTKRIIKMNAQMLNKICILLASRDRFYAKELEEIKQNNKEPYEIKSDKLLPVIEAITINNDIRLEMGHMNFDEYSELSNFMSEYNTILDEYIKFNEELKNKNINLFFDEDKMKEFFDISVKLTQKEKNFYTIRDLTNAKGSISKNLSYFLDKNKISEFENKYDIALKNQNISEMKQILNETQELILDHWKTYVSNIEDFKQGDNFKFICHSTNFTEFTGEFHTKFVSTSLLSENNMDTYNNGFGFVFAPENIVGANSKDMYVYNSAENEDDILFYSSIKKIDSPERLLEECNKLKKENKSNNKNQKVYNEVIIDGFNPIAIFCLTDGSMNLNKNYKKAYELQKQFPNLKIIEIDTTYYKKDEELDEVKLNLIKELKEKLAHEKYDFSKLSIEFQQTLTEVKDYDIKKYDLFWSQFMEMKQKGNYTENDIINIFKHNKELLDVNNIDQIDKYSDLELETILKNNYNIGFNEQIELWQLDKIKKDLGKYSNNKRLDKILPGLTTFLKLYKKVPLNEENVNELKNCSSIDEINQYLINFTNNYIKENNKSTDALKKQAENYKVQIEEYQNSINEKNHLIDEYDEYKHIIDYETYYSLAKDNIKFIEKEKDSSVSQKEYYSNGEEEFKQIISKIDFELEKLKKHKILCSGAIKRRKKEKERYEKLLEEFAEKKNSCIESLKNTDKKILEMKQMFKSISDIEYDNYEEKLENAKKKIKKINKNSLKQHITAITKDIYELQKQLYEIEEHINKNNSHNYEISSLLEDYQEKNTKKMGFTLIWVLTLISLLTSIIIITTKIIEPF